MGRRSGLDHLTAVPVTGAFPGGVGDTHGNKADFDSLFHDVTTKLFDVMPDGATFYPGHGKNSTLGAERPSLPDWRARGW